MANEDALPDLTMNAANLYLEESFTDQRVGSIKRLTPVDGDGNRDAARDVLYVGQAQMMTPVGPLPLSFEIEAANLGEAAGKFAQGAGAAVERAAKELQELQREQASSIVVPGASGGFNPAGGTMPLR